MTLLVTPWLLSPHACKPRMTGLLVVSERVRETHFSCSGDACWRALSHHVAGIDMVDVLCIRMFSVGDRRQCALHWMARVSYVSHRTVHFCGCIQPAILDCVTRVECAQPTSRRVVVTVAAKHAVLFPENALVDTHDICSGMPLSFMFFLKKFCVPDHFSVAPGPSKDQCPKRKFLCVIFY